MGFKTLLILISARFRWGFNIGADKFQNSDFLGIYCQLTYKLMFGCNSSRPLKLPDKLLATCINVYAYIRSVISLYIS